MLPRINFLAVAVSFYVITTGESLKCYQCNSSDTDPEPKCDRLYWKQMNSQERDDLVIDCQKRLSFFCIVIRKEVDNGVITTRGCIGDKDIKGTTLNAGCVEINDKERACLCTDDLCNSARGIFCGSDNYPLLGMVGITVLKYFEQFHEIV